MVCLRNISVDTLHKEIPRMMMMMVMIMIIILLLLLLLLLLLIIIIIIIISSSVSPLCRVSTLIFLRQTMSLGNIVLQLF